MGFLWRILGAVAHSPERMLHSSRRRTALDDLGARPFPRSVLVVCHGNICRSPYAAAALRRLLPGNGAPSISSAGFVQPPGRPAPPAAVATAASRGLDLSAHRSRLLTPRDVRAAELILVMDGEQQRAICRGFGRSADDVLVLGDLDPQGIERRAILDPLNLPREAFERSYDRIDRCLRALVEAMSSSRQAPASPA